MNSSSRPDPSTTLPVLTRRKTVAGVVAASSAGLLVRLGLAEDISARKKHRRNQRKKKRCRQLGQPCTVGRAPVCCEGRTCNTVALADDPQTYCCQALEAPCQRDEDCCNPSVCDSSDNTCVILISDRSAKANFGSVDPADMLERVRTLPITTWNYLIDDASVRHIGPMAQDFTAVFGVGDNDRTIHPMDGQGVALAAIQGLAAQVTALQAEQQRLIEQIVALQERC